MKLLFLALQQYLLSVLTATNTGFRDDVTYIRMYIDHADKIIRGEFEDFPKPAIFIEFVGPMPIQQLGNGNRIYEPLRIRIHTLYEQYDAQDGQMGQIIDVLTFVDKVYYYIQDWMPSTMTINNVIYTIPVGAMQIVAEIPDTKPTMIYRHIQEYVTTWVDFAKNRPLLGQLSGVITYQLDQVIAWDAVSLYTVNVYVSYTDGNIYQCILNTVAINTLPTNTTYFKFIRAIS